MVVFRAMRKALALLGKAAGNSKRVLKLCSFAAEKEVAEQACSADGVPRLDGQALFVAMYSADGKIGVMISSGLPGEAQYFFCYLP